MFRSKPKSETVKTNQTNEAFERAATGNMMSEKVREECNAAGRRLGFLASQGFNAG